MVFNSLVYPARKHAAKVFEKLILQNPGYHRNNLPILYLQGSGVECRDDSDRELPFHQEANFMYLTGAHNIPDASVLISIAKSEEASSQTAPQQVIDESEITTVLFIPTVDPLHVMWSGLPETTTQIHARLGDLTAVKYKTQLPGHLSSVQKGKTAVITLPTTSHELASSDPTLLAAIQEARVVKTDEEIQLIAHANQISSAAHTSIMCLIRNRALHSESDAEIVFRSECHRRGSKTQAYEPIFGYGVHAGTLHYTSNDAKISEDFSGVLLVDAGCETYGYASDITRTLPLGNRGKFTPEARDIYSIVLDMQEAAIKTIKAGIEWQEIQILMHKVAAKGLLKLGILRGLTVDECYENGHVIPFFPHGVGHFIGLDTHDVGGFPNGKGTHPTLKYLRLQRKLEAGNVVTVEPGLYFNQFLLDPVKGSENINHEVLLKYVKVGGIRIEDNVVVTETGCKNLTQVVKSIDEIEKLTSF
ncbi:hypothetical protein PTTG_07275 [Puccinia triticina 1-1 BBBD Race 1]|uniref:AMP_N domain-containing protein n=2 Tax=Puccinia triticina TaxID=208348 RepID=A0A180GH18_PUCT1|nr:uncharacterized protein PtA15_15A87 [Puccinia triticina]OAV91718.1 hypothetical protein PTTG_07275 [Puccinia triticina 1-1 BBBD Race 1]WAQ91696.1 hypothetical protein PtA15_15A87 [Puccinia triticina]WAR62497.1 hypothetical protein PtB15_15B82 [Puccinia triticina]